LFFLNDLFSYIRPLVFILAALKDAVYKKRSSNKACSMEKSVDRMKKKWFSSWLL